MSECYFLIGKFKKMKKAHGVKNVTRVCHAQSAMLKCDNNVTNRLYFPMEQRALQNVNNCFNTNIFSYLETSGGQSSNLCLNVVHFFNTSVNYTSVAA